MNRIDTIKILGIISLVYWCIDVVNNIFFLRSPSWSLWFSSVGIGLTAIGLLTKNTFLLSSLFCALFVVELAWNIGFFSHLIFHTSFMGLTDYLFTGNYSMKDFLITSYHIVMLPFIVIALTIQNTVHKKAWVGAMIITFGVLLLTYVFAPSHETTNCVHSLENCRGILFFLEDVSNPLRTILGILIMTVVVFIPTNYMLVKMVTHKRMRQRDRATKNQTI